MSKVLQRLLIFFVGIPAVLAVVWFKCCHHLPLNAVIMLCSAVASLELYAIFEKKLPLAPRPLVVALNCIVPLSAYLLALSGQDIDYTNWIMIAAAFVLMAHEIFSNKTFEDCNARIPASLFIIFYSGYLLTFITRMTQFQDSVIIISVFLFTVFICDSLAWLSGMLFGRSNKGVFAASPNKSVAGFIGGYAGATAASLLAQRLWPGIFHGSYFKGVLLGVLTATAGIIGDLAESVYKRSSNCKDSGTIIPGRGGILDSIDSILFSAPVYYIAVFFLYNPAPAPIGDLP
ncbi:MAG: phosphatidate cytidylyltransferase [Treponemataceae bacterium]|nr:phosphatidate cytidylyltransferase [Treponemataceae bacterium]